MARFRPKKTWITRVKKEIKNWVHMTIDKNEWTRKIYVDDLQNDIS